MHLSFFPFILFKYSISKMQDKTITRYSFFIFISSYRFKTTDMYGISPLLFAPLGFITTFIVALAAAGLKGNIYLFRS